MFYSTEEHSAACKNKVSYDTTVSFNCSPELVSITTQFTDELMEQGLTHKILTLVSQIDVNTEFEKLQKERGLGSEKHRKEVINFKILIILLISKYN